VNILTFDIEEWFHILDNSSTKTEKDWDKFEERIYLNMDRIFRLLDDTNSKGTFFCLGWIARKYPDIIKRIDAEGYEIGTHSDLHQLAYEQSKEEYKNDLERSIKSLEDIIGKKVISYRAPGFSLKEENKWVFDVLAENGIEIDCSVFPAKRSHGGFEQFGIAEPCLINVNGHTLKEFPINLSNIMGNKLIFSGGGYFRLLPYPMIKQMATKTDYLMTYFHPRDFDPEQPMIKELSLVRKFKSYYGLGSCYGKLKSFLDDFRFIDLKEANERVNWDEVPVKHI